MEAVTTVFYDGALKLFIEVPIVEKQHRFTLYRIFSLPEPQEDEWAVQVVGLPAFLAVSERQDHYIDRFVELSIAEAADCSKRGVRVCRFHTSISKGGQRESCALALLNSDPSAEAKLCRRSTVRSPPPTAQYLGKHLWAVSLVNSPIVFRCANSTESRVLGSSATVFELKEGCTAITGQWILPATLHGQQSAGPMRRSGIVDLPLWSESPSQGTSPQWIANTEAGWPLWKTKHVEAGRALHATRLELEELQRLEEESPAPRYPWELAGGLLLLLLGLIVNLAYRWKKFRRSSGSPDQHATGETGKRSRIVTSSAVANTGPGHVRVEAAMHPARHQSDGPSA